MIPITQVVWVSKMSTLKDLHVVVETFPNGTIRDDRMYFVLHDEWRSWLDTGRRDEKIRLPVSKRVSIPVDLVREQLSHFVLLDVGDVHIDDTNIDIKINNTFDDIPLEDKARFLYLVGHYEPRDRQALWDAFRDHWRSNGKRSVLNVKVHFMKNGVCEMKLLA